MRRIRDALLAPAVDPGATLAAAKAAAEAEDAAKAARAYEHRRACADRLGPYAGRLFLVNNFKGIQVGRNADRVSGAVLARFGREVPIGVVALLSTGSDSRGTMLETANALTASLGSEVGSRAVPLQPEREGSGQWLLSLARAAEATSRQLRLPPEELGCVVVGSALDMNRHANVPWVPAPGAALLLADVGEQARFSWEAVLVDPVDARWAAG